MPLWLKVVFQILFFVFVFLVIYNQLKKHVLSKLHPNKWLILALAVAAFFIPSMIATYFKYDINGTIWQYIQSGIFIVFFLWFVDLRSGAIYNTTGKRSKNNQKNVVIKPKAKPNRAKNSSKK